MVVISDVLFLTVVVWFVLHELDAIQQCEWRFFLAPVPVSDETAYRIFTAVHAPAFVLILWYLQLPVFQLGFDVFMIVHGFLHLILRNHPKIRFNSWFSGLWIYGGALLGALHLFLIL